MSNFGDQARLPTDRPPDGKIVDGFPKTKTILWDKTGIGKPTYLHLSYFRKPRVCIPEKVLKLVQHQCENYGQKNHTLIGSLIVEDDGEAVQFQVDRLDTRPVLSTDVSAYLAPGDLLIPVEVTNNTAGKRRGCVEDFLTALNRLQDRCCSMSSIELSNFVLIRGWVSFYSNAHSSVAHMDFDMVTMGTVFKATPIANVPIVLTALSKNLAGPMSLSQTQGMPKSGYLTMDHTRKLLLVLESDPKAGTLPIVGIWVSGVDFVHHSYVWAACLRYIHNTHLQDRVCAPPEEFLLVLYSPLHSRPEFFQCSTTTGESKLIYKLYCGHEVCNHTKSLASQNNDFTDVELSSEQNGEEKTLFDSALAKHSTHIIDSHLEKRWTDDINPRSIPTPHSESLPVIKPMVPDVSILWTDSPNNSALPLSINHMPALPASVENPVLTSANSRPPRPALSSYQPSVHPHTANNVIHPRPYGPVKPQIDTAYYNSLSQKERPQFSQPYVSPIHDPHLHPSFQSFSSSLNVSNDPVFNVNNQNSCPNPYNVSSNVTPVYQNLNDHTSPPYRTQNPALSYTASHPQSCYNSHSRQETHCVPNTMCTPHFTFAGNPHNRNVISSQGDNTFLATQTATTSHNQQRLDMTQRSSPNQAYPASTPQIPLGHQVYSYNTPHLQNTPMLTSSTADEQRFQSIPTTVPPRNVLCQNNNVPHTPLPRNYFDSGNTLKTVVEETSSSSSSSSTCGGCKCQTEINISATNTGNIPKQMGVDASINGSSHSTMGNSTKSSDDDSGLSVTPERPNSTPPHKPSSLESSVLSGAASQDKCNSAFGGDMNSVNWEQVPPEIRNLLIQQNEQLKLLQQQIQMLMLNQSSQKPTLTANDSSSSNHPPSSSETRRVCSVAVNTSYTTEDHQTTIGSQSVECLPRSHASRQPSSEVPQNQEQLEDEISHNSSLPMHSTSYNNGSNETNSSLLSNHVLSSSKSLSPQAENPFDRGVLDAMSPSSPTDPSKDSRSTTNAAEVSEDFDRSHFDSNYPNDSDYYNNCQDESYSTLAEEATDPRQFYDQIMNNINMFLTNGEDSSDVPSEKEDQMSSMLQDSTTKYPSSANTTLFPHINYMSMMLGASAETGQSMEINAMAMKYLKDDQLTQMAMMLKQGGGGSEDHSSNKLLQRMISAGDSNKASFEVSQLGISPNNLTMGTRNYLEKHGLLENDSQCFNDFSVLDHTLKLNTDFSVAITDRDSDKSSGNIRSPVVSPTKKFGRKQVASSSPLTETKQDPKDCRRQNNNFRQNNYPKDLGASPVLLPPKHYNVTQSPADRAANRNQPKGRGDMFDDDDNGDNENILDIAKLKQLPKLL